MSRQKVTFPGGHGALDGIVELAAPPVRGFALFAHCFTCGKDSLAAAKIAGALAAKGISVMRFDFTGLGGSEGDLGNAGFEGNVEDLIAAAEFLADRFEAPALLIGHSLGGTAILAAADSIPSARAVVTIGAPAEPAHVIRHFEHAVDEIETSGAASVDLAGRQFRISERFLNELRSADVSKHVHGLRRALLVMHSPVDKLVGIAEAATIFSAAMHPKSFVSLDTADHLLTDAHDANYVAATIAGWAERYLPTPSGSDIAVARGHVSVAEANRRFTRDVVTDDHRFVADEPVAAGGNNLGPDPYELLLASLGVCTSMTLRMYANRKRWDLAAVNVTLEHRRSHAEDCGDCDKTGAGLEILRREIRLDGELDAEQRARLLEIADRCPVHRTLTGSLRIETVVPGDDQDGGS